jgi:hypothetical protein
MPLSVPKRYRSAGIRTKARRRQRQFRGPVGRICDADHIFGVADCGIRGITVASGAQRGRWRRRRPGECDEPNTSRAAAREVADPRARAAARACARDPVGACPHRSGSCARSRPVGAGPGGCWWPSSVGATKSTLLWFSMALLKTGLTAGVSAGVSTFPLAWVPAGLAGESAVDQQRRLGRGAPRHCAAMNDPSRRVGAPFRRSRHGGVG